MCTCNMYVFVLGLICRGAYMVDVHIDGGASATCDCQGLGIDTK